jgi:hypothetical protein
MGGSSTKKPLGSAGDSIKKATKKAGFVGDVANAAVKASSGGSLSLNGTGYLEQGNPFEGNKIINGMAGAVTAGLSDKLYVQPKAAAEAAKEQAQEDAARRKKELEDQAKQQGLDEDALKKAGESLLTALNRQRRKRALASGRRSSLVTGNDDGGSLNGDSTLLGI